MEKKLMAALCSVILLMTIPGMTVPAKESINDELIMPENYASDTELMPENYASDAEVIPENYVSDDSETEIQEDAVGEGELQTFTVGNNVKAIVTKEGGRYVLYFDSKGGTLWTGWRSGLGETADFIQIIKFTEDSTKMFLPKDSSYLFSRDLMDSSLSKVKQIDLEKVDTSNVTNMRNMFSGCASLTNLNLSSFDTSNVTTMSGMFCDCKSLEDLDLSSFDTSNVQDMKSMFSGCSSLTNPDLSSFDTSRVTDMGYMFGGCSFTNLDLSGFNTSNVTDMSYMFYCCGHLTNLGLSGFDTSNVTDMNTMFSYCRSLTNLDLSSFNTSNVKDMSAMFWNCRSLTNLDLSSFNTSNVKDMSAMFWDCSSLTNPDLSNFNTSNVMYMNTMFSGCSSLTNLDLSRFDTSKVTSMTSMFFGCSSLTNLDLSSFDTSNVRNMMKMFSGCSSLTDLDLSSFNTSNVKRMSDMFSNCNSLTKLDLSSFDTTNVRDMVSMFSGCSSLRKLDLSSFIISDVGSSNMLKDCSNLVQLNTPKQNNQSIDLPLVMYDQYGKEYNVLPYLGPESKKSILLTSESQIGTKPISDCTIILSKNIYTYKGNAKKPSVTVLDGQTELIPDVDYTVKYENNKNVGTATVRVTGIGRYKDEKTAFFTIKRAAPTLKFENEVVEKTAPDSAFTNALEKITDGTVTYTSSNTEVAAVNSTSGLVTIKGVGTAIITVTAAAGNNYTSGSASYTLTVSAVDLKNASVGGVSLSYGYSGKAYTPALTVIVDGRTLAKDTDYIVKYENNINPGTAKITITGKGNYTGTRVKTFEIVDCVSSLVSGKTYQLIPKNNSKTAVCSFSGKMVNNTKVYITDRSESEAMKFKAVRNADGTWKFINAKCELVLAVQQNSSEVGKGLVLYDRTAKPAQNWKLSRKSDNSFAIINSVTGYSIAMSDASAVKGTTLSMAETQSNGLQRFYIAETEEVDTPFSGTFAVRASKDRRFALNIASSSKEDGANVNLCSYSNINAKKFRILYSGGGYYRLANVNSGLVLTVKGNAKTDGANIIQSKWAAESGQRWKIRYNSDGTVTFTNALGTVLHLNGNKTADNTNVLARKASATGAQKWYLN